MTEYKVLARDDTGLWTEGPTVKALSADAAIRSAVESDVAGKAFVAVPARSWKPVIVTVETVKQVRIGNQLAEPTTDESAAA